MLCTRWGLAYCKHYNAHPNPNYARGNCALGWHGGFVTLGNCRQCMAEGRNSLEAKSAFDAKAARTHPANRPRLSGCCDRADQA
jgi:hypothetical protein